MAAETVREKLPWLTGNWRLQAGVISEQGDVACFGQPEQDIAQRRERVPHLFPEMGRARQQRWQKLAKSLLE